MGFNTFSLFLISSILLSACGGGGGSSGSNPQQTALTTTAGDSVVVPLGTFQQYRVSGGVPPYQVSSSDSLVALGVVNGNSLTLEARDGGKANLRITDRAGTAVVVGVTVGTSIPLYTSAPDDLVVGVGDSVKRVFKISGGTPFNVNGVPTYRVEGANNSVALVVQTGPAEWAVTGKVLGSAGVVKIFDSTTVKGINVTVAAPAMSISPVDVKVPVGLEFDVLVSGGQPPYTLGGNISAAVQVSPASSSDGKFKVKGSELAQIDLNFIDAAGQSIKTKVEINAASRGFRIAPSPVSISELNNDSLTFSMYGFLGDAAGSSAGQVCVYVSDPTYVSLDRPSCSSYSASSRSFNITLGTLGHRCVTADKTIDIRAVDGEQKVANATLVILNTVDSASCNANENGNPALLPSTEVTLGNGLSTTLLITGGTGSYVATTSKPASVLAVVAGNVLTVTGGATAGTSTVVVTDKVTGKFISRDFTW